MGWSRSSTTAFHVALSGTNGMTAHEVTGGDGAYTETLRRVVEMVETGRRPLSDEQLLRPIGLVRAIEESLRLGGKEIPLGDGSAGHQS